jgi:hypothetical protein
MARIAEALRKDMKKIKINTGSHGFSPGFFAIVRIGDKTYVMPGWHKVPSGTTRDQVELTSELSNVKVKNPSKSPEVKIEKNERLSFKALSSKGDKTYNVTSIGGVWDCTCPASTFFRGPCKHIKKFKDVETKGTKAL